MSLTILDWIIIGAYLILSLLIGLYFTKRAGKNISEFFLSGRNLPWWLAGTSMVATTFAADTPLAVTEIVYKWGIAGNWQWWSALLGGMLTTFFFARLWRRAEVLTDLEFIELRYSGKPASFLRGFRAVYLGLFMNSVIIGWVNVALISILKIFFGIEESHALYYTAGCMLLVAFYSALSGMWGVVVTDAIQFIIAMSGCIILSIIVIHSPQIGGISGLKAKLPAETFHFFPSIGQSVEAAFLTVTGFLAFIGITWWASWYPGAEPGGGGYVAQRMLSAKNEKHSVFATLFFQIMHYCARPWPWILVGLCSLVIYPGLSTGDMQKAAYVHAMKDFLPPGLQGLLLVAFFAAYMSTISTQLNWGASYLVNDLYKRFFIGTGDKGQGTGEKKLVVVSRIATVVMMLLSLFATTQIKSISGAWAFVMECGAGLGLVLILRWYWWRINAWSEITATITPFIVYFFCRQILGWKSFSDGDTRTLFMTVSVTTLAWISVTFLTKPTDSEKLKSFYQKIRPEGFWKPVVQQLQIPIPKSRILNFLVCWLSSVVMVYSALFFIGGIILWEKNYILTFGISGTISFFVLYYFSSKTKVFSD